MKAYVITIMDNDESCRVANRCIESGKKFGLDVEIFAAVTPADNPLRMAKDRGIPVDGFQEKYSRLENCVAAFLSHYTLWKLCEGDDVPYTIFEHDAILKDNIPMFSSFSHVMNIGKPSYGKFNTPVLLGVNPLTSKPYMPGAHAYMIKPSGAKALMEKAKTVAGPTDVFMNLKNFPWMEEYYPWPAEAHDSFTTIQKTEGCLAKHNYNGKYKII
jgi:GR25 family glycosyltransferase involved in LPS biosynthesis